MPILLLFDLDGTLLRSDKTISERTLQSLRACREKGILIGVCTARGEKNITAFMADLEPDLVITSGGALVKQKGECLFAAEFTLKETLHMIETARQVCGPDVEITVDTMDKYYWNYSVDPLIDDPTWGETIYTDYAGFDQPAIKMCGEIHDPANTRKLAEHFSDCEIVKFVGNDWHKITKKGISKESAIHKICEACHITTADITAFGDDLVDIGMLRLCGIGVAMGNALPEVKAAANVVIGGNDEDGIAEYLNRTILS